MPCRRVDPAAPAEDTRIAALKAELGPDTTITLHGPFAVVGDITSRELREALSLLDRVDEAMQTQFELDFRATLAPIIDEVSRERGLQFVFGLEQAAIVWWSPAVDISDDVVKRLDAKK